MKYPPDLLEDAIAKLQIRIDRELEELDRWQHVPASDRQHRICVLIEGRVEDLDWMMAQLVGAKQIALAVASTTSRDQDTREEEVLRRRREES